MITSIAVLAAAIALMTHAVINHYTAKKAIPQVAGSVVRICAYCNIIMGAHSDTLRSYHLSKRSGHAPAAPGIIITHGMCQSCYNEQRREIENE